VILVIIQNKYAVKQTTAAVESGEYYVEMKETAMPSKHIIMIIG
jgi:hypothetical protein